MIGTLPYGCLKLYTFCDAVGSVQCNRLISSIIKESVCIWFGESIAVSRHVWRILVGSLYLLGLCGNVFITVYIWIMVFCAVSDLLSFYRFHSCETSPFFCLRMSRVAFRLYFSALPGQISLAFSFYYQTFLNSPWYYVFLLSLWCIYNNFAKWKLYELVLK